MQFSLLCRSADVKYDIMGKCRFLDVSEQFVSAGSPSRGGDFTLYAYDINQPNLSTPFFFFNIYSVLVSISAFMALSTVFHSMKFPDNSQSS